MTRRRSERLTAVAVDWSGARTGLRRKLWLAEARGGRLERVEALWNTREALIEHLCGLGERPLVVGLDFSFSLPEWFLRAQGARSAAELWAIVARDGERWLAESPPPFFGRPGRKRSEHDPLRLFRKTERELEWQPKSTFQIGGAGAVGTGSLRGMPQLLTLRAKGFAILPFDAASGRDVLEIYPRLCTGSVRKSDANARRRCASERLGARNQRWLATLAGSEDALDAALSALALASHFEPGQLSNASPLEGGIWAPPARDPLAQNGRM